MAARRQISTVTVAASSYDLTTLATVKDELGVTVTDYDVKFARYISEVSLAVHQYCNRVFPVETIKDEFWPTRDSYPTVIPGGEEPLQLMKWPVVSVTEVIENGDTLVDGADYRVDKVRGQLVRLDTGGYPKRWPAYPISVTYTAGYATIPLDVSGKVVRMVTGRWYSAGRDPSIMSENIPGVREYRVWVPTGSDAGNMPPDVIDVLNNYRVPITA